MPASAINRGVVSAIPVTSRSKRGRSHHHCPFGGGVVSAIPVTSRSKRGRSHHHCPFGGGVVSAISVTSRSKRGRSHHHSPFGRGRRRIALHPVGLRGGRRKVRMRRFASLPSI